MPTIQIHKLGIALAVLSFGYQIGLSQDIDKTPLQRTDFCKLIANPEVYDGTKVALEAFLEQAMHHRVLRMPSNCESVVPGKPVRERELVAIFPQQEDLKVASESTKKIVTLFEEFNQYRSGRLRLRVAVVGIVRAGKQKLTNPQRRAGSGGNELWPLAIEIHWISES